MTTKPNLNRVWAEGAPPAYVEDPDVTSPGKFDAGWTSEIPPFENFNFLQQLFTQGLAHANEYGIMQWDIATPYPDGAWARSTVDDAVYQLIVGGNPSNEPSASPADWIPLSELFIPTSASVSVSGTATFTNSTNNIALTDIGLIAGLEVGDVISVTGTASNNTEFTVEVITDDDNVIVNQAHAGGTTTKSLVNETVACTVTLLAKWYDAPIGLGQGSVTVTASRPIGVTQTNLTNRSIEITVEAVNISAAGGCVLSLTKDGVVQSTGFPGASLASGNANISINRIIEKDSAYAFNLTSMTYVSFKELR